VAPSEKLARVKSVKEVDKEEGSGPKQDDTPVEVTGKQVKKIKPGSIEVKDGDWRS